jgi:2-polyprenyl-6-methoxyphenol hydroxylase-like FAD-dependent oxidoreductase
MLGIHEENGQLALKAAGLFEKFIEIIHPGGQETRALDKYGNVLLDDPDDGTGGRPEVPRGELRRILLESLPADTVRWGHKLTAVSSLGSGRYGLTFADGLTVTTGLLVGADGAWSKVRPLLPRRNRNMSASHTSRPTCSTATPVTRRVRKRLAVARCLRVNREKASKHTASRMVRCTRT